MCTHSLFFSLPISVAPACSKTNFSPFSVQVEFPIRGPGPDMASRSLIVGRFPLGEPDFRGRPGGKRGGAQAWRLAGVADPAAGAAAAGGGVAAPPAPPALGDPTAPWALEDAPGRPTHVSSAEGMPGGGAGYFVLVRDGVGGAGYTAWPVGGWHTFRPPRRHAVPSLEEAEAAMDRRMKGLQALPNHSRLATMLGRAVEDDRRAGRGGGEEGAGGEDEEDDEDDDDRPGRRQPAFGGGRKAAAPPSNAAAVGAVRAGRPVGADAGAEDWEHEEDRADDDLDMGEDGEEDGGGGGAPGGGAPPGGSGRAAPGGAKPTLSGDEEEDDDVFGEGRPRLTGAGADLKRILAQSGMGESEDEDEEEAAAAAAAKAAARRKAAAAAAAATTTAAVAQPPRPPSRARSPSLSDDDDGDEEEDLDAMAEAYKPGVIARLASTTAGGGGAGGGGAAGPSSNPAPPSRSTSPSGGAKRKAGAAGTTGGETAKKARGPTTAPAAAGPPTDAELVAALRTHGPMPSSSLTAMYKARITGPDARKEFTAAVKRVARLEDRGGAKVIVLKE